VLLLIFIGAASAEAFLSLGYRVLYLYGRGTSIPFSNEIRKINGSNNIDFNLLNDMKMVCIHEEESLLDDDNEDLSLSFSNPISNNKVKSELKCYHECIKKNLLLSISFETVSEYLSVLQEAAEELYPFGRNIMFYLAATVSDFYIPDDMVTIYLFVYLLIYLFIFIY
jgi:phosphopantothenate-cysteine ligase